MKQHLSAGPCKALLVMAGGFLLLAIFLANVEFAYAATWSKMPSSTPIPPNTQVIPLNYKAGTTKITYNTTAYPNKFKTITYSNGTRGLCVKIDSQTTSYTYKNFCTVTYPKATTIRGKEIDVTIEFTSMTIGAKKGNDYLCSDKYMAFARITPGAGTNVFDSANMTNRYDGNRRGYGAKKNLTTKVTVTWSDTGKPVELPFYQGVRDIDATDDYFQEGWYAGQGFDSTFYIWPSCFNAPSGSTMMAKTTNPATSGNEEYTKAGLIAPTNGAGTWYMAWYGGNCGTGLRIYSQYKDLEAPTKSVDRTSAVKGDTITWTVSQKTGTFFNDMYSKYTSFRFSDTIPEGVQYQSANVYKGSTDITSQGTLQYNEDTRKLTFVLDDSQLNNQAFYTGQTISMKITATAENPKEAETNVKNQAQSVISGEAQNTNTVNTAVRRPDLTITKTSDKSKYQEGDSVPFTVTVKQTTENLTGKNVVVTDTLPEGLILSGEPLLTGVEGTVSVDSNIWTVKIPELVSDQTATITFSTKTEDVHVEKEVTNTITASMDDVPEKKASATVTLLPEPIDLKVEKVWEDGKDFYGLRPNRVKVQLLQDGAVIKEMELQEGQDWKGTFEDLPEYRTETERFVYAVKETDLPDGYTAAVNRLLDQETEFQQVFQITNALRNYELELNKEMVKADYYADHGNATFLYQITSKQNPSQQWYEEISFTEADVKTGGSILRKSTRIELPYGEYEVRELGALRYQGAISATSGDVKQIAPLQAEVRLGTDEAVESVTYRNDKMRWDRYSHNDLVINQLQQGS